MTTTLMNYTTRGNVEAYLNRTFPEVSDAQFNQYLLAAEAYINNYCGYNAETTTSGMMREVITREKHTGMIDSYDNLVVSVDKPPVAFDANGNPLVSYMEFNMGGIRISLQLTDGTSNALNTLLEVSENRRKIYYPSLYFFPAMATVTPTRKVNLYNLKDVKFFIDVSYTGGYTVLPQDVVQAANILVADMVLHRDNPIYAEMVRQGSYQIQYYSNRSSDVKGIGNRAQDNANELLKPYVRVTW